MVKVLHNTPLYLLMVLSCGGCHQNTHPIQQDKELPTKTRAGELMPTSAPTSRLGENKPTELQKAMDVDACITGIGEECLELSGIGKLGDRLKNASPLGKNAKRFQAGSGFPFSKEPASLPPSPEERRHIVSISISDVQAYARDAAPTIGDWNNLLMASVRDIQPRKDKLDWECLGSLGRAPNLTKLHIVGTSYRFRCPVDLSPIVRAGGGKVEAITIHGVVNGQTMAGLAGFPKLKILGVRVEANSNLVGIGQLKNLEWLIIEGEPPSSCIITDEVLTEIASLTRLKILSIDSDKESPITNKGFELLGALRDLIYFNVPKGKHITHKAYSAFGTMKDLRRLTFGDTLLTRDEFQIIGRLEKLEYLRMLAVNLNDEGLKQLGNLRRLKTLDIRFNPWLTGSGLSSLRDCTLLQVIYIDAVPGYSPGAAELEKILPNLNILHE